MNVLMVGSGPVIIGQAAEFDYSGTQAVRSLKQEGVRVVLLNSNPATVMTDPKLADRTYLEPIRVETAEWIIKHEKIEGLVAGLGGQAALNLATELTDRGILAKYGVKLLGTDSEGIKDAEDRGRFATAMDQIGVPVARGRTCSTVDEAVEFGRATGFPLVIRPAFTLGGEGSGQAHDEASLKVRAAEGLSASPVRQVLVEEGLFGWKELEFEVLRDSAGNAVAICGMENIDPVGVHTGDSLVVAPILAIPDPLVQQVRAASLRVAHRLGIVGACNVQFALAKDGRLRVIEANPRASRSSALASKAVGYPIAQVAAKLALGRTLAELSNPATKAATAAFEPAIDYVAVKLPCWPFDKVPEAPRTLGTRMRATGEVLAMDRTFPEAMAKAWAAAGTVKPKKARGWSDDELQKKLSSPTDERVLAVAEARRRGWAASDLAALTDFDPFFIQGLGEAIRIEAAPRRFFKAVDGCAGEADAVSPYFYSVGPADEDEGEPFGSEGIVILGSGPIRIGCGLEFDYGSVMATSAIRATGTKTILINNNPETVSTDFDAADRLYFEPISREAVLSILRKEQPAGVIVQFGGQASLDLATIIEDSGFRVLGTSADAIDVAEDRKRFLQLLIDLDIPYPRGAAARTLDDARRIARDLGYPLMIRPSRVLGGRAMKVAYHPADLDLLATRALEASGGAGILLDHFIEGLEMEVDLVSDGEDSLLGVMEHIEAAGVHSGDSMARFPTRVAPPAAVEKAIDYSLRIAKALKSVGMMNVQYVWSGEILYCLEANPRASRTVPFLAKATGIDLAGLAGKACLGLKLKDQGLVPGALRPLVGMQSYKVPAFSFGPLTGVDPILGPEMMATGESMGLATDDAVALAKALAGARLAPKSKLLFAAVPASRLNEALPLLEKLLAQGCELDANPGIADALRARGHSVGYRSTKKAIEAVRLGKYGAVVNVVQERTTREGEEAFLLRRAAVESRTPLFTRLDSASAISITFSAAELVPVCLQDTKADPRGFSTPNVEAKPKVTRKAVRKRPASPATV